ncbi:MAG: tRNA U-34 5-methylaminomethyl-2-thiouridine biosynthesis protein [Candidatus Acinetobacter avistercoris]|nr:tRNA U-34 5-methylaminomethyl-2-thiouridine biosynthesis protein [Candidatus Acinetobacter avistercoris]
MTVVSAFLVPGSPLPHLCPDVPNWKVFKDAMQQAGASLRQSKPDVVLIYSTKWFAVLDELWLTRHHSEDVHVDENWHEFGELPYNLYCDSEVAQTCVEQSTAQGIKSRGVDYDKFPVDTGTIVASQAMGIGGEDLPLVSASNNLYHSGEMTEKLAHIAVESAKLHNKRVAIVAVGELSSSVFTTTIDPAQDHIVHAKEDEWNRKILKLIEQGDVQKLNELLPDYVKEAKVEMGFKHLHWVLGALQNKFSSARIYHYGPIYGSGAAVIEFLI